MALFEEREEERGRVCHFKAMTFLLFSDYLGVNKG
jgi:hypothetical protein